MYDDSAEQLHGTNSGYASRTLIEALLFLYIYVFGTSGKLVERGTAIFYSSRHNTLHTTSCVYWVAIGN